MGTAAKHTTTVDTPSDVELVITRVVDAPLALVWECWTKPEHVRNWLLGPDGWTMTECELNFEPGGKWRMSWAKENGSAITIEGVTQEVVPLERIVSTESWGPEWPDTLNTTALAERDGATTITLTIRYQSMELRDAALKTGATDGMATTYNRLDAYLRTLQ